MALPSAGIPSLTLTTNAPLSISLKESCCCINRQTCLKVTALLFFAFGLFTFLCAAHAFSLKPELLGRAFGKIQWVVLSSGASFILAIFLMQMSRHQKSNVVLKEEEKRKDPSMPNQANPLAKPSEAPASSSAQTSPPSSTSQSTSSLTSNPQEAVQQTASRNSLISQSPSTAAQPSSQEIVKEQLIKALNRECDFVFSQRPHSNPEYESHMNYNAGKVIRSDSEQIITEHCHDPVIRQWALGHVRNAASTPFFLSCRNPNRQSLFHNLTSQEEPYSPLPEASY